MPLTDAEFAAIMADKKQISGNIVWNEDEGHSPARVFRAKVESAAGWSLFVQGRYNPLAGTLTYALILRTEGRIYGLCMGKDHHNPQCDQVGEKHKHRWSERYRDKEAYIPMTSPRRFWNPRPYGSSFVGKRVLNTMAE